MAKLALLSLTVFIALSFTISTSKTQQPHDLPNDDDSATFHDPSITLPEPDSKRKILLPSEKPESEPATMVELEQNEVETEALEMEILEEDLAEMVEKPEMRFAFRDLRREWPRDVDQRIMFVLRRHPHHRFHHPHRRPSHQHHQILIRQFDVERQEPEGEIGEPERSYGNGMLIADPEKGFEQSEGNFDEGALKQDLTTESHVGDGGGRRHAPSRWVGFHFGGRPRFPDEPDREDEHGPHHHHHHHLHHHEDEEQKRDEDERRHHPDEKMPFGGRREENGGGLVKRFRKFLNQIDF